MPQRLAIFGGTFDPVHMGHLIVAEQCRAQGRIDQVLFVPAARPPHKLDRPLTPFAQRVEMLALAIAGQPAFRIDEVERDRPGPSFMADTLTELHRRNPDAELHFILGSDSLADLPQWYEPRRIVEQAGLLVTARPGFPLLSAEQVRAELHMPEDVPLRLQVVDAPLIDIASRWLRRAVIEGQSLRYLVPRAVECYIETHRLYRE